MISLDLPKPYLLFLGDAPDSADFKTARGLKDWAPDDCIGQYRMPGCPADLGLPDLGFREAAARGARAAVLGVAPRGGGLPERWIAALQEALEAGLDLISGMHERLSDRPALAETAGRCGRRLYDIRHLGELPAVATGEPRSGIRVLTVGTDCNQGKKYTALALTRELTSRGIDASFRATGQTGILIAGGGVPADAIKSDFVSGAIEQLAPAANDDHWDVVEGQGSLFHPAYAAVTLGILHGAQPRYLILCHAAGRAHINGFPRYAIPPLAECMDLYLRCARVTSPAVRFAGVSLNTAALSESEARAAVARASEQTGVPCTDVVRYGAGPLADALLAEGANRVA